MTFNFNSFFKGFNKKSFIVWLSYVAVLLTMSYFAYFYKLGNKTFHIWDESRNATSAYELSHNGKFLTPTYGGEIDMWSTKPPLLIGCQAICIKLFGNDETSIRLPSAMAATLAVLTIFLIIAVLTGSKPLGFLAAGIFLTTPGILPYHALRQADFESFLLCFSLAFSLVFLYFLEKNQKKYLYLAMSLFTLAFLSKSSASLFFLPGIFIFVVLRRKALSLAKDKHFYLSLLIPVIVLGGYYLIREQVNPGYIKAVYNNEFGGRAFTTLEGHAKPFLFYYNYLTDYALGFWFWVIPAGIVLIFFEKNKFVKNLFLFSAILAITHLLIISLLKTKLEWYCLPEVPFWAILSGISIYEIMKLILKPVNKPNVQEVAMIIVFIGVLYYPVVLQYKLVKFLSVEETWQQNIKFFLRERAEILISDKSKEIIVITDNYDQNARYYIYKLSDKGYNIRQGSFSDVKENTYIVLDIPDENKMIEAFTFCAHVDTLEIYTQRVKAFYVGEYYTKEQAVEYVETFIINNLEFKNYIEEKAVNNGVAFEKQLYDDASYLIDNACTKVGYSFQ